MNRHLTVLAEPGDQLDFFGHDPWWLVVVKAVFCFAFLMVTVLFSIVWERKVVA
ncbi:NADH-quinone oxidoreductase subunit H, partial [Streptomyces bottropensis]